MTTRQTSPEDGIGTRIREARRDAGLSQRALAAIVGVGCSTISRWEAGEAKPSREHLAGIALHCGTGVLELAGCEEPGRAGISRVERMNAVVGSVARHQAEHGYPPTLREVKRETGFSSISVVKYWLDVCEGAGLIVRARGIARAVTLTDAGRAFAEAAPDTGSLPERGKDVSPSAPRTVVSAADTDAQSPPALQPPEDPPCLVAPVVATRQDDTGGGIATRIREARRGVGLTQLELARLLGVSPHTVWCWEAGRMKPTYEHRVAIAFHCERDVAELEGRAGPERDRLREAVAAFLDAVTHLPEEDIDSIWRFVRFLRWRRRRRSRAA